MLLVDTLNNRDFLSASRQKTAVPYFFDADDRVVVLQQHWNREKVGDVLDDNADGCRLPGTEIKRRRLKTHSRPGRLRRRWCYGRSRSIRGRRHRVRANGWGHRWRQ